MLDARQVRTRTLLLSLSLSFSTSSVFPAQSQSFSPTIRCTSRSQGEIKRRIEDKLRPKDGYVQETGPTNPVDFTAVKVSILEPIIFQSLKDSVGFMYAYLTCTRLARVQSLLSPVKSHSFFDLPPLLYFRATWILAPPLVYG